MIEYKFEAFQAFQDMVYSIKEDVVRYILRVKVVENRAGEKVITNQGEEESKRQPVRVGRKLGVMNAAPPVEVGKKIQALLWERG